MKQVWVQQGGGFLVMDKSSGDVCFYKPDELAKPNVPNLIKTLQDTLKSKFTT